MFQLLNHVRRARFNICLITAGMARFVPITAAKICALRFTKRLCRELNEPGDQYVCAQVSGQIVADRSIDDSKPGSEYISGSEWSVPLFGCRALALFK